MLHQLPAFRTRRLTVRPRTIDDLEACMAIDHDTEVTRFLPGPWTDPVAHSAFVEARMRHAYLIGMGYWSVIAAEEFVGWILLTHLDLHASEIEIGWRFVRAAWGRGFATEAARPEPDHALNILGLAQVIADIDPANMAWANLARKPGFRLAGSVRYNGHAFPRYVACSSAGQK
jgi:RimJ/RimL family protein N-acetyltransferase